MQGEVQFKSSLAAIPSMQFTQKKVLKSSDPFLSRVSHLGESWLFWNSNQFTQSMWQWLVTYLPLCSHPLDFSPVNISQSNMFQSYQTQIPSLIIYLKICSNSAKTTAFHPSQLPLSWVASRPYKQKVMIYSSLQLSLRMAVDHTFLISSQCEMGKFGSGHFAIEKPHRYSEIYLQL